MKSPRHCAKTFCVKPTPSGSSYWMRFQTESPAEDTIRDRSCREKPGRPIPDQWLAVVDFHAAEDRRKKDCEQQAESSARNAKLPRSVWLFAAKSPDGEQCEQRSCDAGPDINAHQDGYVETSEEAINDERDGDGARRSSVAWMNFAEPGGQVAVLRHGGGNTRGVENGAVGKGSGTDDGGDQHGHAERFAANAARSCAAVAGVPVLPVAERGDGERCRKNVGQYIHRRVPQQDARKSFLWILHFAGHAGELFVAGVVPHGQRQADSKYRAEGLPRWNQGPYRVVVPLKKGNTAKPDDRKQDGDEHRDGEPRRDLNAANVQIGKNTKNETRASPFRVTGEPRKIVDEIVHYEDAVKAVQQEGADPIPPAALESPEVAEGRPGPAIEATLHGKNAIKLGRSKGDRNTPKEWDEDEEQESHSGARLRKNVFVAE